MTEEHKFAQYIRFLGKGRNGSRSLSQAEAKDAMAMILAGEVEPIQLGAFLMLVRVKEETSEELAGFVQAARASIQHLQNAPQVAVDWPCYAGKRRQLPWFLLSALLLSSQGMPVFMHGISRDDERVYLPRALEAFGIKPASSVIDAGKRIRANGFAYLPIELLSAELAQILELRSLLGLRSPVHTVARMLNPFNADLQLVGVFHPNYAEIHQKAAQLVGESHLAVFKGEGGEVERNPDSPTLVRTLHQSELGEEEWPAMFSTRHLKDETMDLSRLVSLWRRQIEDEYGEATVVGTAAIALLAARRAPTMDAAQDLAQEMWDRRDIDFTERLRQD